MTTIALTAAHRDAADALNTALTRPTLHRHEIPAGLDAVLADQLKTTDVIYAVAALTGTDDYVTVKDTYRRALAHALTYATDERAPYDEADMLTALDDVIEVRSRVTPRYTVSPTPCGR